MNTTQSLEIYTKGWNESNEVQYYFKNKFQQTITRQEAIEKMVFSTALGMRIVTGISPYSMNFLLIEAEN